MNPLQISSFTLFVIPFLSVFSCSPADEVLADLFFHGALRLLQREEAEAIRLALAIQVG